MIRPAEIQKNATQFGVRDAQIEKDYVLSWLLKGISQHKHLSKAIVFKGGTVLKKIYFDDYRFSEDLDFTLIASEFTNEEIFDWFQEVFEYLQEEVNIPLEIIDNHEHDDGGINFYVTYRGPLGGQGSHRKVKVDISRNEPLVFDPVTKDVFINYSDLEAHQLLCYPLEEVLVEKMRCVMQRMQARDFYDLWYLLEENQMEISDYMIEFEAKCRNKDLNSADFPTIMAARLPQYKARWKGSLSDQIKDLPGFDQVERSVMRHVKKLKF